MTSQSAWMIFILKCTVVIDEASSKLGVLLGGPPLSLFDMLLMRVGGL